MFDPGWPATHYPRLWVRVDDLPNGTVDDCWPKNKRTGKDGDKAADCTTDPETKWALWELAGKELRIIQDKTKGPAKLTRGKRKLGGRCWKGKQPDATSCKGNVDQCKTDISWVPEYAKAQGNGKGRIRQELLDDPQSDPSVGAVVRGLIGTLEAEPVPGKKWGWEWNHPSCRQNVPQYEQRFNHHARIVGVESEQSTLYLVDLATGEEEAVELSTTANSVHVYLSNMPEGAKLIPVGDDHCVIPHFDHYSTIVESPSSCRRIPYIRLEQGENECDDVLGDDDPICPPTLFNRGGGGG
jgi:hypothetical protein